MKQESHNIGKIEIKKKFYYFFVLIYKSQGLFFLFFFITKHNIFIRMGGWSVCIIVSKKVGVCLRIFMF